MCHEINEVKTMAENLILEQELAPDQLAQLESLQQVESEALGVPVSEIQIIEEEQSVEEAIQLEAVNEQLAQQSNARLEAIFEPEPTESVGLELAPQQQAQSEELRLIEGLSPEQQAQLRNLQQLETQVEAPANDFQINQSGDSELSTNQIEANARGDSEVFESQNAIGASFLITGIIGTPNPDKLNGTGKDDEILGLAGNDTISGKGGNDGISGGSENDLINGNAGDDLIFGDASFSENLDLVGIGNDTIKGGKGNDAIFGQNGEDSLLGGAGNDLVSGGNDNDILKGGKGNDRLFGQDGEDKLLGQKGDDTLEGGNGNDLIIGNQGKDTLRGDSFAGQPFSTASGNDTLIGGGGDDILDGGRGDDILVAQNGDDQLVGGQGNDELNGGSGKDKLIGTDTVFFAPQQFGFGAGERDTLTGGRGNDTFVLGLAEALTRTEDGTDGTVNDVVLYDDGNVNNIGTQGYALIEDFGYIGDYFIRGVDKIQLAGSESEYSLGASPIDGIDGTGIFLNEGQNTPELIGIVKRISEDTLNLSDNNQFIFV
jgi:Ca2+-binding RTX toxin-like protein